MSAALGRVPVGQPLPLKTPDRKFYSVAVCQLTQLVAEIKLGEVPVQVRRAISIGSDNDDSAFTEGSRIH